MLKLVLVAGMMLAGGDAIDDLLQKATETFHEKGYSPTGWVQRGSLAEGAEKTYTLTLTGGHSYHILGACDTSCNNLDAVIRDSDGNDVNSDTEDDDFPIVQVSPARTGTYSVTFRMVECSASSCLIGVKAFQKD